MTGFLRLSVGRGSVAGHYVPHILAIGLHALL